MHIDAIGHQSTQAARWSTATAAPQTAAPTATAPAAHTDAVAVDAATTDVQNRGANTRTAQHGWQRFTSTGNTFRNHGQEVSAAAHRGMHGHQLSQIARGETTLAEINKAKADAQKAAAAPTADATKPAGATKPAAATATQPA